MSIRFSVSSTVMDPYDPRLSYFSSQLDIKLILLFVMRKILFILLVLNWIGSWSKVFLCCVDLIVFQTLVLFKLSSSPYSKCTRFDLRLGPNFRISYHSFTVSDLLIYRFYLLNLHSFFFFFFGRSWCFCLSCLYRFGLSSTRILRGCKTFLFLLVVLKKSTILIKIYYWVIIKILLKYRVLVYLSPRRVDSCYTSTLTNIKISVLVYKRF